MSNPNVQRMLLGSNREIEPTIAVGDTVFTNTLSRTWPGNGYGYQALVDSWTVPDNWASKSYRYTYQTYSTGSYTYAYTSTNCYVNGVSVLSVGSGSYYRNNSGYLTWTVDVDLKGGDVFDSVVYGSGRNVGGNTPTMYHYHELRRLT